MRVLIFDPFHGAAGDMITGALLDCGADREVVMRAMAAVVAEPVDYERHPGRDPCPEGGYKSNTGPPDPCRRDETP